jgi:hypothetical protein
MYHYVDIGTSFLYDGRMSNTATSTPKTRGRKPDANSTSGKIRNLLGSGMAPGDIAKELGCSASLVYNVKARLAGGKAKRVPGRPPKAKATAGGSLDGISGILEMVKRNEAERARLLGALTKMAALVREALA